MLMLLFFVTVSFTLSLTGLLSYDYWGVQMFCLGISRAGITHSQVSFQISFRFRTSAAFIDSSIVISCARSDKNDG